MTFITESEYAEIKETIPKFEHIRVFEESQDGDKSQPIELGINWTAIGTVRTEEAKDFAKDLQEAIKYVEDFNASKFVRKEKINFKNLSKEHIKQEQHYFWVQAKDEDTPTPWDNAIINVDHNYIYIEGNIAPGGVHLKSKCTLKLLREDAESLYELNCEEV